MDKKLKMSSGGFPSFNVSDAASPIRPLRPGRSAAFTG